MSGGLWDTSVWIAVETGREVRRERLPERTYVSVVTLAEIEAGVLAARDVTTRARRLETLQAVASVTALPVEARAARHWARLRVQLQEAGRRCNVNDLWIASIALAHDLPVVTQDGDYDVLVELGGPEVVRV